ncbi:MAG: YhcH/YjgK/YiaL family protein [Spirochaetia bacterium]
MILDILANRGRYGGISPGIGRALDYLSNTDFTALEDGKQSIDEDGIYALVMTYSTEPESERSFEAHRKHIDVQYILQAQEIIFWAPTDELSPVGDYSQETDIVFLSGDARARLQLTSGSFAVFYPEDAHKPNCAWNGPQQVRKVVVKVPVR